MSDLREVYSRLESGSHECCDGCPYSPARRTDVRAFGRSCELHGADWGSPTDTVSLQIVQEPAGMCFVCNGGNPSDTTARQNWDLWRAAVSGTFDMKRPDPAGVQDPYLKHHFWTNSTMHGVRSSAADTRAARRSCAAALDMHIRLLKPRVLIACGRAAADSCAAVGLLPESWDVMRSRFAERSYCHAIPSCELTGDSLVIFVTYTTAARAVNVHAARLFDDTLTASRATERAHELGIAESVARFATAYGDLTSPRVRGMRMLLLHWLEIGAAIRAVNE